jgi:hypothetical protein
MNENKDKPILKNESAIKLDAILNRLYNYMSYYGLYVLLFTPSDYIRKDLELSDFIKEVKE